MKPRGERAIPAKGREPPPCLDENILHQLGGLGAVTRVEPQAQSEDSTSVLPVEKLEGIDVSRLRAPN